MKTEIERYLKELFGETGALKSVQPQLPLYLRLFSFYEGVIAGAKLILAEETADGSHTPLEYLHLHQQLAERLGGKIVFVFARLDTARRNQLIRYAVPFIVPGLQFYLPPNICLQERVPVERRAAGKLSPMAQAMVIRELNCRDVSGRLTEELSQLMRTSAVTIGKVTAELKSLGVGSWNGEWPRHFIFQVRGKELWMALEKRMRSPVKEELLNALPGGDDAILAGESAMARRTMLSAGDRPVFACKDGAQRNASSFVKASFRDEARSVLQVWRYDPSVCGGKVVDPLSLYLSMKDEADPRVQQELETMMENMKWA